MEIFGVGDGVGMGRSMDSGGVLVNVEVGVEVGGTNGVIWNFYNF